LTNSLNNIDEYRYFAKSCFTLGIIPYFSRFSKPPRGVLVKLSHRAGKKSLQGVSDWLAFFVVVFCLQALGYVSTFFLAISNLNNGGGMEDVASLIFSLPIAALAVTTVVFIGMQKKTGRLLAFSTLGVTAFYSIIIQMITMVTDGGDVALNMGTTAMCLVYLGLIAVYFAVSKRVKATLVN
jgi:hypothetical protein